MDREPRRPGATHSGATADRVSLYSIDRASPIPGLNGDITVGLNPFGIACAPAGGP